LQQFNYNPILPNFRKICHLIEKEKCLQQPVVTVEMNAKYLSSQKKIDLFIVENASKTTNPNKGEMTIDLVEDLVMAEMIEVLGLAEAQEMSGQEKCLQQPVVTVEMNAKYLSSQKKIDLFIVQTASKNTNSTSLF